jgi:hypothetical protein
MCIYEYDTGAGYTHCVILSNKPLVKGRNYKKTALQRKAILKSKQNHQLRLRKKAALDLAIKCVMVESVEQEITRVTDSTSRELTFALSLEKHMLLGEPLPQPHPIRSGVGIERVTSLFKKDFSKFWKEAEEHILPKKFVLGENAQCHGDRFDSKTVLTMPGVQKSRIPDHVIASIHQPTTSIPITKTSANPNLVF